MRYFRRARLPFHPKSQSGAQTAKYRRNLSAAFADLGTVSFALEITARNNRWRAIGCFRYLSSLSDLSSASPFFFHCVRLKATCRVLLSAGASDGWNLSRDSPDCTLITSDICRSCSLPRAFTSETYIVSSWKSPFPVISLKCYFQDVI